MRFADEYALLFVNNNIAEGVDIVYNLPEGATKVKSCKIMKAALSDVNTFDEPEKVVLQDYQVKEDGNALSIYLPATSILMLTLHILPYKNSIKLI